jgi:hypothetical protein
MRTKLTTKTPSKQDLASMLRRKGIIGEGKSDFDFSKIENIEAIAGIAGYLARKIPEDNNVVLGFISDNSGFSRAVAAHLKSSHFFVSQDNDVRPVLARFNGPKKVNVVMVKALITDIDMNDWNNLPYLNANVERLSAAAVADGRFLPYEDNMHVFSLIDYEHIYP